MTLIDWLIIGCFSLSILCFILFFVFLLSFVQLTKKQKALPKRPPKNKRKRRKWKRKLVHISEQRKRSMVQLLLCLFLALISTGGGVYSRYYQSLHLSVEDKEIISQSYFILSEVETELKNIQSGADIEKTQEKMKDMLSTLVSYTSRQPATSLSVEGQQQLRNYYKKATEFGTNLYGQTDTQLEDKQRIESFLDDTTTLRGKQKEIFDDFGIDEGSFKTK